MNSPAAARVLVAGEDLKEARQLAELLKDHFENVGTSISTNADSSVAEFEKFAPDIIVMAFKTLEQAERYYLALHRFSQAIYRGPHRTILLCRKEDTVAAFDLCKKRYFDDYVLYWPNPQDGLRIPMSVWLAARGLQAQSQDRPTGSELRAHARDLQGLDRDLTSGLVKGEKQVADADTTLQNLERKLASANDAFSHHLVSSGANGAIEVRDPDALAREFARFKQSQIEWARTARDQGLAPIKEWATELKEKVEPALGRTRSLATQLQEHKPTVLAIDDDEAIRTALEPTLTSLGYEPILAATGQEAMRVLAHVRPDVILLDVHLPDIDGIGLTRQLRLIPQFVQIPIVLMSGEARRDTLLSGIEAGAIDFLAKPFSREVLRVKLDKVLRAVSP